MKTRDDVMFLLREADPATARAEELAAAMPQPDVIRERAVSAPHPDASDSRPPLVEGSRSRRPRRLVLAVALGAAAATAALALLPGAGEEGAFELPRPAGDPTEGTFANAFGALSAASAVASSSPQGEGPYPYVHLLERDSDIFGEGTIGRSDGTLRDGPRFVAFEINDREIWFRPGGSTHVIGESSGTQFPSPEDEELERTERLAKGLAPPYAAASQEEADFGPRMSAGGADRLGYYGLEPEDQRLPRDPGELAELFASVTLGSSSAGAQDASRAGDMVQTFDYASTLLLTAPYDKELRAAAYEVVANLDGVTLDGRVRDPVGRLGTLVEFEAAVGGRSPTRYSLIFDTDTSEPLAYVKRLVNPRTDTGSPVIDYLVLLDAGRTDSIGVRPD